MVSAIRLRTDVMAITSLPRGRLCRDAVPTLPRDRFAWLDVGLHADFDLGILG
jgi:hypothetical protein